jgi:hypothetical protein
MKKNEVQIGAKYIVKVSGNLVPVKITSESQYGGWYGKNTVTGREVRIKTAGKLRRPVPAPYECTDKTCTGECGKAHF